MQGAPPVRQEWRRRVVPPDAVNGGTPKMPPTSVLAGGRGDLTKKGSAKALLHELCSREHWKLPVYECYYDEGPPHQKRFTFKVVVEVGGAMATTLECFGYPQTTKRAAADAAAEAALWYLRKKT